MLCDQKPRTASALAKCLTYGTTAEKWFELVSFADVLLALQERSEIIAEARALKGMSADGVSLDAASLVDTNRDRVRLSPIRSGAAIYNPARGPGIFLQRSVPPKKDQVESCC